MAELRCGLVHADGCYMMRKGSSEWDEMFKNLPCGGVQAAAAERSLEFEGCTYNRMASFKLPPVIVPPAALLSNSKQKAQFA